MFALTSSWSLGLDGRSWGWMVRYILYIDRSLSHRRRVSVEHLGFSSFCFYCDLLYSSLSSGAVFSHMTCKKCTSGSISEKERFSMRAGRRVAMWRTVALCEEKRSLGSFVKQFKNEIQINREYYAFAKSHGYSVESVGCYCTAYGPILAQLIFGLHSNAGHFIFSVLVTLP